MLKKIITGITFLSIILVLITGCSTNTAKDSDNTTTTVAKPLFSGYWKSSYGDGFELSQTIFTAYDDTSKNISFAGNIVNYPDLTLSSGALIVKITNGGSWAKTPGKFYTVRWKGFSNTTVKESGAYKGGGLSEADTQAQAESEYTEGNGYFGFYGDYIKQ